MVRAPLYEHTTTEIRGHARFAGNGTSANASRTAASAGLGERSARVRPKAQSSTSWPCRYHSSVQENTTTPAHPAANAVRTCQSSERGRMRRRGRVLLDRRVRSEEHTSELQSLAY